MALAPCSTRLLAISTMFASFTSTFLFSFEALLNSSADSISTEFISLLIFISFCASIFEPIILVLPVSAVKLFPASMLDSFIFVS